MTETPEELGQKIKAALDRQAADDGVFSKKATQQSTATAKAVRAATDLVAAVAVGGFLGYWIDRTFGTKPFAMLILFFLGFIAGFINIYRSQTGQDYKVGFKDTTKDR